MSEKTLIKRFEQLQRTVRTVRHLRARQVVGQILHRLRRRWNHQGRRNTSASPAFPGLQWSGPLDFMAPTGRGPASEPARGLFSFLNEERLVGWPPDWEPAGASLLWVYNLHYFEWLWALPFGHAREAVLDWIEQHVEASGRVGWEAYPTSLRLQNWCALFWGRNGGETAGDPVFQEALWRSVWCQAEWLAAHLEYRLMGNHLLENAASLTFVGSAFRGEEARRWLSRGRGLLRSEIREQMLGDGMHFERSPMYHARVLYVLKLLSGGGDMETREFLEKPLHMAEKALQLLCHPDGEIALLNDSALGIAYAPGDLFSRIEVAEAAAGQGCSGAWGLKDAGYYGWRDENSYLVCDAGAIGPDYLPGHAHGDIFSFELSWRGHRVIVDSGVFDYMPGEMRDYCRSTRAHNTVEIDGQDQCEFWGAFRVARRGHPREVLWQPSSNGFRLSGWHDGYRRLPGRPKHSRAFKWHQEGLLLVRDEVEAACPLRAVVRLHMHPACEVSRVDADAAVIWTPAGEVFLRFAGAGELVLESGWYCPEFGRRVSNPVLAWHAVGPRVCSAFSLSLGRSPEEFDVTHGATLGGQRYGW